MMKIARNSKTGGAPAWMVTFADLMSLLLTLFVLLLTFAEMDIVRYKAIAGSVREAFGISPSDRLSGVIELEGTMRRSHPGDVDPSRRLQTVAGPVVTLALPDVPEDEIEQRAKELEERRAEGLQQALMDAMADAIKSSGVTVERREGKVVIRFPSGIAFPSGSAELSPAFRDMLDRVAPVLRDTPGDIQIAGHTDNVPVTGETFRSNWDLSASRATSVAHHLLYEHVIDPRRITIQGFGDSRPLVPNTTEESRARNRRVELSILAPKESTDSESSRIGRGG